MSNHNEEIRAAYDARRQAVEQLRSLDAEVGETDPSEEQRSTFAAIHADIDRHDADLDHHISEGKLDERSAYLDGLIGTQRDAGMVTETGLSLIEQEARDLFRPANSEGAKSRLEFTADVAERSRLMRRDLTAGTAGDGAELVPTTLFGELYVALREGATSMFSLGRNVITTGGEAMAFPSVSSFSAASLIAEGGAVGESDPQFVTPNVTMNAYKYGLSIQISPELEQDNAVPGALPWVVSQAVDGIRRGVGSALVVGDGSDKPNGVINGSTTSTATGVTYPTADNLLAAQHDIGSGYRPTASWVMNDATVLGIRLLKDSEGQYIWRPGLVAGSYDTLLGSPVVSDDNFATIGANAKIGVYGDISAGYLVRIVNSIRAERSDQYAWLNDLITWRFLGRFDGEIIDNSAFTVITNEAA
jgi:HK97 family phage major capsid protein